MKPDDSCEVKTSPVEGLGVFARREFAPGQMIRRVNIVREVTDSEPLDENRNEHIEHCSFKAGRVFLYGLPDRYVNHSCDPNAYYDETDGELVTRARRTIKKGAEIKVDYLINNSGGNSWACHCGATRCRGMTGTSFFDLPAEFQREYLPLLLPWFRPQHSQQLASLAASL